MSLLFVLDECNCAFSRIELCAQLGLRHPEMREAVLMLILTQCHLTDQYIGELMLSTDPYVGGNPS